MSPFPELLFELFPDPDTSVEIHTRTYTDRMFRRMWTGVDGRHWEDRHLLSHLVDSLFDFRADTAPTMIGVAGATLRLEGRVLQYRLDRCQTLLWFRPPLLYQSLEAFPSKRELLVRLMKEDFSWPYGLSIEEVKKHSPREKRRAAALQAFFGSHYEELLDVFDG